MINADEVKLEKQIFLLTKSNFGNMSRWQVKQPKNSKRGKK